MNDLSMVERGPIGQPVPQATPLETRSLLSKVIETQPLPPERYKGGQKGEVVDLKKIGETTAVLKKVDTHFALDIFDQNGNSFSIPLDPSLSDIAAASKVNYIFKPINVQSTDEKKSLPDVLSNLGFRFKDYSYVNNTWSNLDRSFLSSGYDDSYYCGQMKKGTQGETIYIPMGQWKLDRVKDQKGDASFTLSVEDNVFQVSPSSPSQKRAVASPEVSTLNAFENKLINNMQLEPGTNLFRIKDANGKELASYAGTNPITDPSNPNQLYFINTGQVYKLDLTGVATRSTKPILESQLKVQNPQELDFDPNGNFIVIRAGDGKLVIAEKETGDVAKTVDGIKGPVIVDDEGDILFIDPTGKLKEIQTNFQAIPSGGNEAAAKKREAELKQLQERFSQLELKQVEKAKTGQISEEDVAKTLRQTISKQVTQQIKTATDPEAIEDILDRLQALKSDQANQAYGEVIDEFVGQAKERLSGIRTANLDSELATFSTGLDQVKSVGDTIGLDEQFAKLLQLRQKVDIADMNKRREIEQKIRTIQTKKDLLITQYQGELIKTVQTTFPQIEGLIRETGSTQELSDFATTAHAQQFEMMLANIRDPQVRKDLRERINQAKQEQRGKLEERARQLEQEQRVRWAQVVEETRADLDGIREQIAQLGDAKEVGRFERNPLVTAWRAKLYALPPELRELEEKKLDIILSSRKKDIEHRKQLGAVGEADDLQFGKEKFPIYKEPPRIWQPKLTPIKGGFSELGYLTFEDSQGRTFKPDPEHDVVVNADLSNPQTRLVVERYRKMADEHFKGLKRKIPDFDEHWRVTDYHKDKLEEITQALNLQLANHRGILILQGEAGTGKNVLVDILANLSNREVTQIACNENSVKEDLTYEWKYNPQKGTYEIPSRLVTGIQTPGTIILFDEINALKPGIAKMMNPLFDYHRRLFMPGGEQEQEIITDPSVIFIGTMNPQNYAGVNRLSPEVKSRARVIDVDYPPFEEMRQGRTHYRSDEAEMLGAYMDNLRDLKQKEFKLCWDFVINRDTTNGADVIVKGNKGIESDMRRVYDVIRTANRLREMYVAYQIGDSNEPMDFPTSLREVSDIVMEMNHRQGVKPIVKRVIIPKIDDRRQKRLVDQTIDAVLP